MAEKKPKRGDAAIIDGRKTEVAGVSRVGDVDVVRFVDSAGTVDKAKLAFVYQTGPGGPWTIEGRLLPRGVHKEMGIKRKAGAPFNRALEIASHNAWAQAQKEG